MIDIQEENYYCFASYAEYSAPYNPDFAPLHLRPEDAEDWTPPKESPSEYRDDQDVPVVALSIPPEDSDPTRRIRPMLKELQSKLRTELELPFEPTLYMTLMPMVPGKLNSWDGDRRKDFLENHAHPGVGVWRERNEEGRWVYRQKTVKTVRLDRTWQAVIHFDPMLFASDAWSPHFAEYTLFAFHNDTFEGVSFQNIHDACPLIGVLIDPGFVSCGGCAYNNIFCRTRFIREAFDAVDPNILDSTVWFRKRPYDSGAISLRATPERRFEFGIVSDVVRRLNINGWYKASSQVASARRSERVELLQLSWIRIRNKTKKKREAARKGVETRKRHDEVCGTGEEVCVLRKYDCLAWRGHRRSCSHRREREEDLNEEALARLPELGRKTPVIDIQRAALLAMDTFEYVSSETNRILTGTHCGAARPRGKDDVLWRIEIGPQREETLLSFHSYQEMRRWFRRWAPWELERLDEVNEIAPTIEVSDLMRCVFYAVQSMTRICVRGGFGNNYHRVTCYEPNLLRKNDGSLYVAGVTGRGNGYSLGQMRSMVDFWHTYHPGFTRAGGILPA